MWCENCCSDHFDYLIIFYSSSSTSLEIYVFVTFWTVKKKNFFLPHLIDTVLVLICIYIYLFLLLFCVFWQNAFCPDVIIMVDWMLNTSYLCICWQKIVFVWFFVVQMTHDLMKTVHDEKLCLLVFCCSNDSWSDEDCAPWKTVCFLLLFLFKWLMTWWRLCPMKNCLLFFVIQMTHDLMKTMHDQEETQQTKFSIGQLYIVDRGVWHCRLFSLNLCITCVFVCMCFRSMLPMYIRSVCLKQKLLECIALHFLNKAWCNVFINN